MENKIFVSTCKIVKDNRVFAKCNKQQITQKQLDEFSKQLENYLLKIDYTQTYSYDSSDDDRVEDSYRKWNSVKYCEIDVLNNSNHLVVENDVVVGVMFIVSENNGDEATHVFLFDGSVQETMSLGYSASHSRSGLMLTKFLL